MYRSIFTKLEPPIVQNGRSSLSPASRSAIAGSLIILTTLGLIGMAYFSTFSYPALIFLGIIYGFMVSRFLTGFLAPRFQYLVTGFLAGFGSGTIGAKETKIRDAVESTSEFVNYLAHCVPSSFYGRDITGAVRCSVWISILTTGILLACNAYYANKDSSTIGTRE